MAAFSARIASRVGAAASAKSRDPRRNRMPHRRGAIARAAPFRAQLAEYARIKPPTTPIPCGSLAHGLPSADRKNAAAAAVRAACEADRRIYQAPPVSKEAGDSEQDLDHSNSVHHASRLAALSALAHLSHHLLCPRSVDRNGPVRTAGSVIYIVSRTCEHM